MDHVMHPFLLALATAAYFCFITAEGGQVCYECNSKEDNCSYQSIEGARESPCSPGYSICSVYKKVPPDGHAQLVRYCDDLACDQFNTTWETGKYQKTKHCRLCCNDKELCNDFTVDPCDPSKTGRLGLQTITVMLLGVIAALQGSYWS